MPLTRIVVADDDADFRLAVCTLLRTMAPSVSVVADVADGEQALAVARRERPAVVLTDLIMPRLNGVELARRIRQELPDTRIIIMSSHTEDTYRLLASDSDADLFITKGVVATRLVSAIHDVTDRSGDRARETRLGDLLHADKHGVMHIPHQLAAEVPEKCREMERRERPLIELSKSPDFTVQRLKELMGLVKKEQTY